MMDMELLKFILFSSESNEKDEKICEEFSNALKCGTYPLSESVINALCNSFANLLNYKVSEQMHQRHTIQLKIIETLRLYSEIRDSFGILNTRLPIDNVSPIATKILVKYITPQYLKISSMETLMFLCKLIMNIIKTEYLTEIDLKIPLNHVVIAIAKHPSVDESKELLVDILQQFHSSLDNRTIEIMYIQHTKNLIEKPLIDDFAIYNNNSTESEFKYESLDELFFENLSKIPLIFQRACVILKEIFIKSNYDARILKFTQLFIKEVKRKCNSEVCFFDLYPLSLQSCIILMNKKPALHSHKSQTQLFKLVKRILCDTDDDLIILLMHFPSWLGILTTETAIPLRGASFFEEFL